MTKLPLVSVCCIAYNQEAYIKHTIEGFLMQKTTFPIEILIHDDASTDNTARIIKQYSEEYPDIIRPILQKFNQYSLGIKPLQTFLWPLAKGKYIALCEGDDYWIDPFKLQMQVDFLEQNNDYGAIFTDFHKKREVDEIILKDFNKKYYKEDKDRDLIRQNVFTKQIKITRTATSLIRTELIETFQRENVQHNKSPFIAGDTELFVFLIMTSKVRYLSRSTTVYRVLRDSISHTTDYKKKYNFQRLYQESIKFAIERYGMGYSDLRYYIKKKLLSDLFIAYYEQRCFMGIISFTKLLLNGFVTKNSFLFLFGAVFPFSKKFLEKRKKTSYFKKFID